MHEKRSKEKKSWGEDRTVLSRYFDTWGDYLDYCEHAPRDDRRLSPDNPSTGEGSYQRKFSGVSSFKEAMNLALTGWEEGANRSKKLADPLFDRVSSLIEKPEIVYDVTGMQIDIGRYMDNEPECWQRYEYKIDQGDGTRIIKMFYNVSASAGITKEVIEAKGAVASVMIELLEYAGNRVELYVGDAGVGGNYKFENYVLLKKADQPLDMPRIAFAVSHPAMLRRLGFACIERIPLEWWNSFQYGYGHPEEMTQKDEYDIYIGKSMLGAPQWTNEHEAQLWVIEQLKKQGIHLHKE